MALLERKTLELGEGVLLDVDPGLDYVSLRVGNVNTKIKRVDLWAACFAIADADTQEKLMPVRKTEVMTFERIHKVRLKKDLHAGDIMRVKCHVDVPMTIEENLKGLIKDKKKSVFAL